MIIQAGFEFGFGWMIFLQSYAFWKNWKFTFISLSQKWLQTFKLKFDILMNLINIQVEVYICSGPLICQMCPLSFEKKREILSFCSLTFNGMHTCIYKSEISYVGYLQKKYRSIFYKVLVRCFLTKLCLMNLGKMFPIPISWYFIY